MSFELNYEASVPGLGGDGKKAAPFFIKADGSKAPGIAVADFIPSSAKIAQMKGLPPPKVRSQPRQGQRLILEQQDYIAGSEMEKIKEQRRTLITSKAKEILLQHDKRIREYHRACKLIANATKQDMQFPSAELERAMRIREFGLPMDKKRAIAQAKRIVLDKLAT